MGNLCRESFGNLFGNLLGGIFLEKSLWGIFVENLRDLGDTGSEMYEQKTKVSLGIFLENLFWESFWESFAGINLFGESFWGIFLEKSLMRIILGNLCLKSLEGIVWGIFFGNRFGESFCGIFLGDSSWENLC